MKNQTKVIGFDSDPKGLGDSSYTGPRLFAMASSPSLFSFQPRCPRSLPVRPPRGVQTAEMLKRGVGRREELRKEPAFEVTVKSQSLISDLSRREGRWATAFFIRSLWSRDFRKSRVGRDSVHMIVQYALECGEGKGGRVRREVACPMSLFPLYYRI